MLSEIYTLNVGLVTLDEAIAASARHMMKLASRQARRSPRLADDLVSEAFSCLVEVLERLRLGTLCPSGPTWQYILSYVAGKLRRYVATNKLIVVPPTSLPKWWDRLHILFNGEILDKLPAKDVAGDVDDDLMDHCCLNNWERAYTLLKIEEELTDAQIADRMEMHISLLRRKKAALQSKVRRRLSATS